MQSRNWLNQSNGQAFIIVQNNMVIKVSQCFANMTEYEIDELQNQSIGDLLERLRVGPDFEINKIDRELEYILFTKSLEARFVSIEVQNETDKTIYVFSEKPYSRLEEKLIFEEHIFTDNKTNAIIVSAPDLIILKANQKFLDILDEPYNIRENTIGRKMNEIVTGFAGSEPEALWNSVIKTQKAVHVHEGKFDGFARGATYWDTSKIPVCENGRLKYIYETSTEVTERVLNREKIRKQNQLLKRQANLLNLSNEAIFAWELDGAIIYWNKGAEQMYGYSSEEAVGVVSHTLLKTVRPVNSEDFKLALLRDGVWKGEIEHFRKDGKVLTVDTNHQIILDENGQHIVLETGRDVTERKKMEREIIRTKEALESNLELLKQVGELAQIGAWEIKLDDNTVTWSDEVCKIHEVPLQFRPTVQQAINFYDENSLPIVQKAVSEAVESGKPFHLELSIITAKGNKKHIRTFGDVKRTFDGKVASVYGAFQDITEYVSIQQSAQERQKLIEAIVNLSPDILYIYDLIKKQNVYSNEGIQNVLGYTPWEVNNMGDKVIESLMHPEDYETYISKVVPAYKDLKDGEQITHEYRMRNNKGKWINLKAIEIVYTRTLDGQPAQIFGVIHDITDTKVREIELIKENEKAEAANIAKSQFLANMSHEIRTPMNGVKGTLQLLEMTDLTQEQTELINMSKKSTELLLKVINDILDYSKIEARKVSIEKLQFKLNELIDEVALMFKPSIVNKNLTFNAFIDHNMPQQLNGDPLRLKQILSNLIGNAIKFTHQGGIELKIRQIEELKNGEIRLEWLVRDTGIGIDQAHIKDIFNSFNQVDNTITRQYGGTGLGLSITKGLVELMQGDVWVESVVGEGSSFHFTCVLEKSEEENATNDEKINVEESNLKDNIFKLLIVEDDEISRMVIGRFAAAKGWQVTMAENGREAIDCYKQDIFDAILMDVQMPVLDGYQAAGIIRKLECQKGTYTPIIAMTAYALKGDREKCLGSGMDDYIFKPIDAKELCSVVEKWANRNTI